MLLEGLTDPDPLRTINSSPRPKGDTNARAVIGRLENRALEGDSIERKVARASTCVPVKPIPPRESCNGDYLSAAYPQIAVRRGLCQCMT
ncbi:hypothetical protein PAXRUDRAFT_460276 [Paxillus rubicundulus Ve08.2h10]|uniref:Uncharacterized protein n=1 Tax=Paxillus rubicundulus Ve08.2h10 TaxID=930991 RepID=A0A0D0DAU9_9AGAM|nr:hypothetical protein PAXRUDRAFT_460276 [Paxillus rubicundulus Ve08.2h10]